MVGVEREEPRNGSSFKISEDTEIGNCCFLLDFLEQFKLEIKIIFQIQHNIIMIFHWVTKNEQ